MIRQLPLIIGIRYSAAGSGSHLVSFLSRLSMAGLVLGVALLVTVMSVMNGFDREMRQRILSLVPQITLEPWTEQPALHWQSLQASVQTHPDVVSSAPFLQGNGLLIKGQQAEPALFYGIDPDLESSVSRIGEFVDLSALAAGSGEGSDKGGERQLAIGAALAVKLGVAAADTVSLAIPGEAGDQRGARFVRFRVVAVVETGTELDQHLLLMSLTQAETLLPGRPLSLRVAVRDVFDAPRVAWELNTVHGRDYALRDWSQQFGNMYHAIQMSRRLVVIMLLAVVAVAVFNIVSTLVLVVNDKRADIAILRSQGATRGDILLAFVVYGGVIGTVGAASGALLGMALSAGIGRLVAAIETVFSVRLLQSDVYPISYLPADIRLSDVLTVCAVAIVMSFVATLYPAWRASRQPPAEALRHG